MEMSDSWQWDAEVLSLYHTPPHRHLPSRQQAQRLNPRGPLASVATVTSTSWAAPFLSLLLAPEDGCCPSFHHWSPLSVLHLFPALRPPESSSPAQTPLPGAPLPDSLSTGALHGHLESCKMEMELISTHRGLPPKQGSTPAHTSSAPHQSLGLRTSSSTAFLPPVLSSLFLLHPPRPLTLQAVGYND